MAVPGEWSKNNIPTDPTTVLPAQYCNSSGPFTAATNVSDYILPAENPYKILGVQRNCDQEQIKKAHRDLALKYHPDRQRGAEQAELEAAHKKFVKINLAFARIGDEDERYTYDTEVKWWNERGCKKETEPGIHGTWTLD